MNATDRIAADRQAVERLRQILSNMDPQHMKLQAMGGEMMLTCDAGPGKYAEVAVILPDASEAERNFFLFGPSDALAAIRVIDRATAYFRQQRQGSNNVEGERKGKKHGSECAMLCNKPAFGRFIADRYGATHGPVDATDPKSVGDAVKAILKIKSRSVLNTAHPAVDDWIAMRSAFEGWLRT